MNTISLTTSDAPVAPRGNWLTSIRRNLFITGRGFLLLLFLGYLFIGPVVYETDIVASILSISLAGIFLVMIVTTIVKGYLIKRIFNAELDVSSGEFLQNEDAVKSLEFFSHQKSIFILKTSPVKIIPFFSLQLQIVFKDGELEACQHIISGASDKPRYIREELVFPHRGRWCIGTIALEFRDRMGISFFSWDISHEDKPVILKVKPRFIDTSSVPVISSRQRPGDTLPDHTQRQGEPFDLKPYHPSDGMRKILWKVYARSGELLSRHPEASMTPEGQVIIFSLANKNEDDACGATLSYVQKLEDLNLDIFIGCEGMSKSQPAYDHDSAEELFLESVWRSGDTSLDVVQTDLFSLLKHCQADHKEKKVQSVILFCSAQRLADQKGLELLEHLATSLSDLDITPVFVLVKDSGLQRAADKKKFLDTFVKQEPKKNFSIEYYDAFIKNCARNRWQVIICPDTTRLMPL